MDTALKDHLDQKVAEHFSLNLHMLKRHKTFTVIINSPYFTMQFLIYHTYTASFIMAVNEYFKYKDFFIFTLIRTGVFDQNVTKVVFQAQFAGQKNNLPLFKSVPFENIECQLQLAVSIRSHAKLARE